MQTNIPEAFLKFGNIMIPQPNRYIGQTKTKSEIFANSFGLQPKIVKILI